VSGPGRLLDACVIIDFHLERPSLLSLIAKWLGPIYVPTLVLGEVRQLDETTCQRLGLETYQMSFSQLEQAIPRQGILSLPDRSCLVIAEAEGFILYTNEKAMRNVGLQRQLDVRWGLELLIELADIGKLDHEEAARLAESICGRTPFPTKAILSEFRARLHHVQGAGEHETDYQ
jgi:hypothetical protein